MKENKHFSQVCSKGFALFIISIFSYYTCISQTCVVGKMYQDSIFFGSDSRTTRYFLNGNKIDTVLDMICKIHQIKNFYFSNIHSFADHSYAIAKEICERENSIKIVLNEFAKVFIRRTLPLLQKHQTENPAYFESLARDSMLCQTVFFGFEDDLPYLVSVIFRMKLVDDNRINLSATSASGYVLVAGEISEIINLIENQNIWQNGAVAAIDKLIGIEIAAHPKKVAYPIDIIKVTKAGNTWLRRKSGCNYEHQICEASAWGRLCGARVQ